MRAVLNKNTTIIQAAYDQCRLYRQYLRNSNGLWTHIVMGTNPDRGLWASGALLLQHWRIRPDNRLQAWELTTPLLAQEMHGLRVE